MTSLTDVEIQALHEALDDEYHAWATYTQVLQDFGPVRPFLNIRDSELRHIQALHHLFQRYSLEIPVNPWQGEKVARFASLQEACEAGVQAEIDNVDLYKRILNAASQRPDIVQVFLRLQGASQQCHLPAFQRAAARLAGPLASTQEAWSQAPDCGQNPSQGPGQDQRCDQGQGCSQDQGCGQGPSQGWRGGQGRALDPDQLQSEACDLGLGQRRGRGRQGRGQGGCGGGQQNRGRGQRNWDQGQTLDQGPNLSQGQNRRQGQGRRGGNGALDRQQGCVSNWSTTCATVGTCSLN